MGLENCSCCNEFLKKKKKVDGNDFFVDKQHHTVVFRSYTFHLFTFQVHQRQQFNSDQPEKFGMSKHWILDERFTLGRDHTVVMNVVLLKIQPLYHCRKLVRESVCWSVNVWVVLWPLSMTAWMERDSYFERCILHFEIKNKIYSSDCEIVDSDFM